MARNNIARLRLRVTVWPVRMGLKAQTFTVDWREVHRNAVGQDARNDAITAGIVASLVRFGNGANP
jgi:hypothetical protein